MPDPLFFAESLLAWQLANYAFGPDPVCDDRIHPEVAAAEIRPWPVWMAQIGARGLAAAVAVILCGGSSRRAVFLAAVLLAGSILLPVARRRTVPLRSLAEFDLLVNCAVALLLWFSSRGMHGRTFSSFLGSHASENRLAALCICIALFVYSVRGGTYIVRGILEKTGGIPPPAILSSEGYTHGRVIGQVERAIVFLIVIAGNLQALAFFFAAKGLIRSRELEDRTRVDYLLLGSLASFLVALAGGLLAQRVFALLPK
jgi:hypothetical protein